MKKITITISLALFISSGGFAQTLRIKDEPKGTKTSTQDQAAASPQVEVITSTTKSDAPTTNTPAKKTDNKAELNRPPKSQIAATDNKKTAVETLKRNYEYKGSKYAPVPLIGDTKYYGKDHDKMMEAVKKYINSRSRTYAAVQKRDEQGKIFAMMHKIFDKYDIPHELKYLAVIESTLNKNALSPVGAYGPWQFMPSTGQMMGLTVNGKRDERADWSRSTHAACKYLNYLYTMFDDWLLVVASYNWGPGNIQKVIRKTGKTDYWSIKKHLPAETQNHVIAFVATATAFELLPQYATTGVPANFDWKSLSKLSNNAAAPAPKKNTLAERFSKEELQKMSIVRINAPVDLDFLANYLDIDRITLARWNYDYITYLADYKDGSTQYALRIPKEKFDQYLEKKDVIEKHSAKTMRPVK